MATEPIKRPEVAQLLLPREHGLWGMLALVLLLPPAALGVGGAAYWIAGAALILVFAKRPGEVWLGAAKLDADRADRASDAVSDRLRDLHRGQAGRWALGLVGLGLLMGLIGLAGAPARIVIPLALAGAAVVAVGTIMEVRSRGDAAGRLGAMAGLVLLVPLQEAVALGVVTTAGWGLAMLIMAFFLSSFLRVRSQIRARKDKAMRLLSLRVHWGLFMTGAVAAGVGLVPVGAGVAMVPGLWQARRIGKQEALATRPARLGTSEIVHTLLFAVVVVVAYRI